MMSVGIWARVCCVALLLAPGTAPVIAGPESPQEAPPQAPTPISIAEWGIQMEVPGYKPWPTYPKDSFGANLLLAALSSGECQLNLSMFAEQTRAGATAEDCVRDVRLRQYLGNPDLLAGRSDIRGLIHEARPLTYTRFDQVYDDPHDELTGKRVKARGPFTQNQLFGYWTRGRYCFELHVSAMGCASFDAQAMPILRSVVIGPDTGATLETIELGRATGSRHDDWRVNAQVAKGYVDKKAWDRAVPFFRSALALGGDAIPEGDLIDLRIGLGDALIRDLQYGPDGSVLPPGATRKEGLMMLERAVEGAKALGDANRLRRALYPFAWGLALAGDQENACARARELLTSLDARERKRQVTEIRTSYPPQALHRSGCYRALLDELGLKWKKPPM